MSMSSNLPFMLWTRPEAYIPLPVKRAARFTSSTPVVLPMTVAEAVVNPFVKVQWACEVCGMHVNLTLLVKQVEDYDVLGQPYTCIPCTRQQAEANQAVVKLLASADPFERALLAVLVDEEIAR